MVSRRLATLSLAALAFPFGAATAQQESDFPSKPIRLIVPFPPASNPDILARLVAQSVSARLKQPVVVENRPGAGGMIGTSAGAKAPPDGYTLLVGDTGPLAIAPWLYQRISYNPTKDFNAVAALASVPILLMVPGTSQTSSPSELVTQAKSQPMELMYGSLGVGSIHHLAAEIFSASTGIKLRHIPYKSNAELATALINGDVHMGFSGIPSVEAFVKDRRLKAIAISTVERSTVLPEVKTLQEQGIRDFEVAPTLGILAPTGVPSERLKILEEAFLAAISEPKLVERIDGLGMFRRLSSGVKYQGLISSELERYGRIVKAAGIEPQ